MIYTRLHNYITVNNVSCLSIYDINDIHIISYPCAHNYTPVDLNKVININNFFKVSYIGNSSIDIHSLDVIMQEYIIELYLRYQLVSTEFKYQYEYLLCTNTLNTSNLVDLCSHICEFRNINTHELTISDSPVMISEIIDNIKLQDESMELDIAVNVREYIYVEKDILIKMFSYMRITSCNIFMIDNDVVIYINKLRNEKTFKGIINDLYIKYVTQYYKGEYAEDHLKIYLPIIPNIFTDNTLITTDKNILVICDNIAIKKRILMLLRDNSIKFNAITFGDIVGDVIVNNQLGISPTYISAIKPHVALFIITDNNQLHNLTHCKEIVESRWVNIIIHVLILNHINISDIHLPYSLLPISTNELGNIIDVRYNKYVKMLLPRSPKTRDIKCIAIIDNNLQNALHLQRLLPNNISNMIISSLHDSPPDNAYIFIAENVVNDLYIERILAKNKSIIVMILNKKIYRDKYIDMGIQHFLIRPIINQDIHDIMDELKKLGK